MIIESVILYVADKIAELIIQDEIWTKRIWHRIKPPADYKHRLRIRIGETILQYEELYPVSRDSRDKFPFYHSQVLFDLLSRHVLFQNGSTTLLTQQFEQNPNIIRPSAKQLECFYNLFLNRIHSDEILKTRFIDENYRERIFTISSQIEVAISKLNSIKDDTQEILHKIKAADFQRNKYKELTAQLPLLQGESLVQRETDLVDVHNRLMQNKQVVLVNGMGGIGKTTLAQMYMTRYYDCYKHLAWISISTSDFVSDFIQTAGLKESLNVTMEGKTPKQCFDEIIIALKGLHHAVEEQSLIILDNTEESILQFRGYLPHPPNWHVLTTSRHNLEGFDVKVLDFLSREQAIELFKLHYRRKTIPDDRIGEIVEKLEYHTLTIEILAKTAQNANLDVNKTVDAIAKNYTVDVNARHANSRIDKVTSYLCSIFDMSKLGDDEVWLLKQFYFLPSQYHSASTIETILQPIIDNEQTNIQRILSKLTTKGWLLYNETTNDYKLHRIIGDVLNHPVRIPFSDVSSLVESITSLLSVDDTKDNPVDKFQWVIFGKHLLEQLPTTDDDKISTLQNNLGLRLRDLGDYSGAKELLEKAVASDEKNFGANHPNTTTSYSNLAMVLQDLGDYSGAKGLLEKAVASDEKNFGADHPNTAVSYSNLALVLKDLGDYNGAKGLLEKVMISDERNFGAEHPTMAVHYSNLALVLQALGDYSGAKGLLEKVMISDERNFGANHPSTARSHSNLALVLQNLGDYNGAKELLEKAVASDEKNFGADHPSTALCYSNLALVLRDLGDYNGAKGLLEKVMVSNEKNFGADHPSTAGSYSNLALVLQNLGDYIGAKGLLEKAVVSNERNFGADHPNTAVSYSNLALVLQNLGDYNGAKELLEKAVASDEKNFGADHPSTAISYSNLAMVLQDLGEYSEAKRLLEKSVKIFEKALGPEHPYTKRAKGNLEFLFAEMKKKGLG